MSNVRAIVKDGKLVENTSAASMANGGKATGNKSTLDKDAFLGLLVAQMRYQDPLQPTSNTEYISQYATFSSLEQMNNMSQTMEMSRAASMVGKTVKVSTVTSDGLAKEFFGKVDYVVYENNKAYVSINEELYSVDDVYATVDDEYFTAYNKATELAIGINKLPAVDNITVSDKEDIEKLGKLFDEMSEYEKTFVAKDYQEKLQKYKDKLEEVLALEEAKKPNAEDPGGEDPGKDDETPKEEGTEGGE